MHAKGDLTVSFPYPGLCLQKKTTQLREQANLSAQDLFYILDLLYFKTKKWRLSLAAEHYVYIHVRKKKLRSLHGTVGFAATIV